MWGKNIFGEAREVIPWYWRDLTVLLLLIHGLLRIQLLEFNAFGPMFLIITPLLLILKGL